MLTAGHCSSSGININENTSLKLSAFYSGIRLISETIASLPLNIFRRLPDGGKELQPNHPLFRLLHDQPNEQQTAFEFREFMTRSVLLQGNALAIKNEVGPSGRRRVVELIPVRWDRVEVDQTENLDLMFKVRPPNGQPGETLVFREDQVFRLMGPSDNNRIGRSLLEDARNSLGISIAAEKYGAKVFTNDARPGGVLKHPGKLNKEAETRLVESWNAAHASLDDKHRVALLEEGMEFQPISISSQDAQLLESRKFGVAEMARFLRIPLHMLYDDKAQPRANMEQAGQEFLVYSLRPWLVRWEQRIKKDLIIADQTFFAEHNVMGLLRGDVKTRFDGYAKARQWGWLSVNDIRRLENLNPVDNGDIYLQPLNMVDAGSEPQENE